MRAPAEPTGVEPYRIPEGAPERAHATGTAADFVPPRAASLPALARAAAGCEGCRLHTIGTQTVFGAGPRAARVMFVGEQPGDQEDRAGKPFVGPSGKLLDAALERAGIDRGDVYVTNAVKHFKWTQAERGAKSARRIHKTPNDREIKACRPWLEREIALVQPEVIVCLGATAAQALLGKQFRVTKARGKAVRSEFAEAVIATVHPSAVLRSPAAYRAEAEAAFFADIEQVARQLARPARRATSREREVPLTVASERRPTRATRAQGARKRPAARDRGAR